MKRFLPMLLSTWLLMSLHLPLTHAAAVHPSDAALRCVQFVDEHEGWAVGDDGAIWHSITGGKSWERQKSGVLASLRSVQFLTPYTGWIVGRAELPGGGSYGVVLSTTDGGLKWTSVAGQPLPGLNCVRFFDQRTGIAAGDGSDTYPTGLFITGDGGQTWRPVPGKRCATWLAADFTDTDTGSLGGPWSQLATLRDGLFGAAEVDPVGGRSIKGLKVNGPFAVAVGQGGLILTSSKSAGLKWGFAEINFPKEVLAACDFEAVAVHGKHLWVAGRPGTFVLHSADLGQNWEMQKTGQTLALHSLHFLNENLGWATGEMGTILTTQNGGRSWVVARQSAQRAAVLFVNASNGAIPLETIALLGEDEAYHTAVLRLTCAAAPTAPPRHPDDERVAARKIEPSGSHPRLALDPEKLNAAMRYVGGTAGDSLWQFPLPQHENGCTTEQMLAYWDKLHGKRSDVEILRQIVLAIRIWRPEVIVTGAVKGGTSSAEALLVEVVEEAFKQAANPQAFPEQLSMLKLSPWSVKKLYGALDKFDPSAVKIPLHEVMTRLSDTPRDFAQPAAMFLSDSPVSVEQRCFQLLRTRLPDMADVDLMEGINLAYGGQARRDLPPVEEDVMRARPAVVKAVQKRRLLEGIIRGDAKQLGGAEQVVAQILPALKEMPAEHGARAAYAIAQQFAQNGQWAFAREAYLVMVDQYPRHPLTLEAYRWLVRYQSSGETRRRQELRHVAVFTDTTLPTSLLSPTGWSIKGATEIVQANNKVLINDGEDARKWFQGCLEIEPHLSRFGPMYAEDPAMQLCLQSARRQLGDTDLPRKWFSRYLSETAVPLGGQTIVRGADAWRDCAMAELWLINHTMGATSPKPIMYCPRIETRPKLDGMIDDECWQGVQPMILATTAGELETWLKKNEKGGLVSEYTSKAWFAYDRDFLYIAVQCTHPAGGRVPPVEKRTRDMDLRAFDRVSILLDLDRDYQTYFQLQIDQRGCVAEDCWGDAKWDPNWYVAVQSDETSWTVEAAIPFKELTANPPTPGTAWAANVTRIVPAKGVQAWSVPADAKPRPEGMGLLQFLQAPKK